jgi:transposase
MRAQQVQIDSLRATVAELQERVARAQKDSTTSSKPPSSDLVKPPPPTPPAGQAKRSIGGQPGHPRHERPLLDSSHVNGGSHTHVAEICPECGHGLQASATPPRIVQQIDIESVPLHVEEHRALAGWCPRCQKVHYAAFPSGIEKGGLVLKQANAARPAGLWRPSRRRRTFSVPLREEQPYGSRSQRFLGPPPSLQGCSWRRG